MDSAEAMISPVRARWQRVVDVESGQQDFESFYASSYTPMVRLAWSLVDSRELAEEAVQDAFAAMLRRFGVVDDPAAYLRTCVLNNCRRMLRRRRLLRRHGGVDERVEDDHDHLFDAIRRLPARQREVIVLRYQLAMTEPEIATVLGIPLGTVKSSLSRAKDRLREEWAP